MARKKRGGTVVTALGIALLTVGAVVLGATLLMPEQTERIYGQAKTQVNQVVDDVREQVLEEYPTVRLGVEGGMAELDSCDGTFTIMTSYEREGVPTTAAAHNNCGGDVLLPWDEGQRINIDGLDGVYEIVDIRYTSKIWSSTDDLVGLQGDIALQSCFYGEDRMKFIGLERVEDA
ncbi:hypothetical protein [Microbacterium amylolyticum]|uniref:Uncharacterized protein n=1 Tax=Microbacterium amylolyticum TaxID=936337 RepID=A0ABS4ZIM9_9MICO|nr:hypothetical protein [Microbacterium amylolyticum]MBP2436908.1 hypothetical protein [Microbacterium amylolyticum]